MPPLAVALMLTCGLAGLGGCRVSQRTGPAPFFDDAWHAATQDKGAVWFFPAVDEVAGWDESRVDRVYCPAGVAHYWCAPVEIWSTAPMNASVYGTPFAGPFGVVITGKVPHKPFAIAVRNHSYFGMGLGEDCPREDRRFPLHPESFTVVVIDSRAFKVLLGSQRYCPSTSILGIVSHAPGRESALRAIGLAGAVGNHASLRIAALEALARSPDSGRCREVHDVVRRIQDGDPSRRVRDYAKQRWPREGLERAQASGGICWP